MGLKESKTTCLQIADRVCDGTLLGRYQEEERIPPVREYAAIVGVNANMVMRSSEYLQSQNIIYNKRGIGYFASAGAEDLILSFHRKTFLKDRLEHIFRQLCTLRVSDEGLSIMYRNSMMKQK